MPSNFYKTLQNNKADLTTFSTFYIISLDDKNAFWPKWEIQLAWSILSLNKRYYIVAGESLKIYLRHFAWIHTVRAWGDCTLCHLDLCSFCHSSIFLSFVTSRSRRSLYVNQTPCVRYTRYRYLTWRVVPAQTTALSFPNDKHLNNYFVHDIISNNTSFDLRRSITSFWKYLLICVFVLTIPYDKNIQQPYIRCNTLKIQIFVKSPVSKVWVWF